MLANTLTTDYRHFFDYKENTFAYWAFYKFESERNTDLVTYWNQDTIWKRDKWDKMFVNNTSYQYVNRYDAAQNISSMSSIGSDISQMPEVHKLWPRESEYFYVLNRGDTP